MSTLTPEQLPNSNAQFIAYGSPERVADPFGGDEAISIRPQVFVRYYRGMKIKDLRSPNDDTVNVVFDPESVGLEKEFGAYMNTDDRVAAYLREQFEAGNAIDIGVEYQRRKKTKKAKQGISPLPPIHALRGANNPDGTGDNGTMLGMSGDNIHGKIALVNGRRTTVIQSDPREWQGLVSNTQGDLPPAGWKALSDPEDWTRIGVITPKGGVTPAEVPSAQTPAQQGASIQGLDMNTLSKIIGNEVRKGLKDYGEHLMREEDAARGTPASQTPNSSIEGKPWTLWVNKDQMNLGSYLVSGEGHALRWAFTYLGTLGDDVLNSDHDLRWEAARELADASQKIADRVQSTAYNGGVRADRTSASFKEAVMWVRFHVENTYPFSADDGFDYDTWFDNVGRSATISLKDAENSAHEFIAERYPKAEQATAPSNEDKAPAQDPGADRAPIVAAYLQLLTQKWTDRDGVFNLAKEAKQKSLLDVEVWANPHDGKFSVEPFDGGKEITIGHLTRHQHGLLSQAADTGQTDTTTDTQTPHDQHEVKPPHKEESAPQSEVAEPQPGAPAPQAQARTAQHIAAALAKATTENEISSSYQEARELNLLTSEIAVQQGVGHFGISPVRPDTEGAEPMTLGAVFDALRAAVDEEKQPAPQNVPAQDSPASETPETQPEVTSANTQEAPEAPEESVPAEAPPEADKAQELASTDGGDNNSVAEDIGKRALEAEGDPAEIKALLDEAREKGIENEVITIRGGKGPLERFLDSRLKRAERNAR